MLKYLLAFAFFFGMAVFVACQDERAAQEGAQKPEHLASGAASAKSDAQHPQQNVPDSERHLPGWYGFFRWPNGTTTWAIILTLLAIAEQTKETAKAAKSAQESAKATRDSIPHQEKAAKAAFLNAQAVINAERPWIVVEVISRDSDDWFEIIATNYGRTPAQIVGANAQRSHNMQFSDLPPDPPTYTENPRPHDQPFLITDAEWTIEKFNLFKNSKFEGVTEYPMLCWGVVHYRDTVGSAEIEGGAREHDTWYCFMYDRRTESFRPAGAPRYTRYT